MKRLIGLLAVVAIFTTAGYAGAFRPEEWDHIPSHGPAPAKHFIPVLHGDVHPSFIDGDKHPSAPHVHMDEKWIGHNTGPADPHYKLANPWANGHFPKKIGRKHIWQLVRGGSDRGVFVADEYLFKVAPYDIAYCSDWEWTTDKVTFYSDPDHAGWYLAYNLRLGTYVHANYQGSLWKYADLTANA